MKPEPLLPKLPSLGELLKHPTVQRVVERVNQTTVAQRSAGFLEELRSNLVADGFMGAEENLNSIAREISQHVGKSLELGRLPDPQGTNV